MRLSLLLKWLIVVLKKANFISTHAIKPPFSWTWKFSWRLDPSLWLSWLQEYQVWVVHTNSLNPPDSKKTILESGFRERIHWFRVDGRLICRESLRFEKYPDSYRRGQNCYKKWRLTQFLFSYSNILVIFLILGSVKIEKGWIHGKQRNDLTSNTNQQKRRQTKHFSNRSNKVQRKYSLFKKKNLAACIVDETHTIKTWTGLMNETLTRGHVKNLSLFPRRRSCRLMLMSR